MQFMVLAFKNKLCKRKYIYIYKMTYVIHIRVYSLFAVWHTFCKQFMLLVLVITLLHPDLIFDSRTHFRSFCLTRRKSILVLREERWIKRHPNGDYCSNNYCCLNKYCTARQTSSPSSSSYGKCKNNKIYNNYQVCRTRRSKSCCEINHCRRLISIGGGDYSSKSFSEVTSKTIFKTFPLSKCGLRSAYENQLKKSVNLFPSYFLASAQTLPDFTTEDGIFTGLPTPRPPTKKPLTKFDVSVVEAFASFTDLNLSWKSEYNVSRIRMRYEEKDYSQHIIDIPVNITGQFTRNTYPEGNPRKGFVYRLAGLTGRRRYFIEFWAYLISKNGASLHSTLSILTGERDSSDQFYNLNGIFMVLGISTIIMLVVMICVGYEKLLHEKKKDCADILCCRRRKKSQNRAPNGSISPEPLMIGRRSQVVPIDHDSTSSSSRGYGHY